MPRENKWLYNKLTFAEASLYARLVHVHNTVQVKQKLRNSVAKATYMVL